MHQFLIMFHKMAVDHNTIVLWSWVVEVKLNKISFKLVRFFFSTCILSVCLLLARIAAITRAFKAKGEEIRDRMLSSVHFLVIRRKLLNSDLHRNRDINGEHSKTEDIYYWSINIHVSSSNSAPSSTLYIDDESNGSCIRVGKILQYDGNNKYNKADLDRCQKSLNGVVNALVEDRVYLKELPLVSYVELLINQ